MVDIEVGASRITLLGTAHVSRTSAETVRDLLKSNQYDAVAIELCPSRYNAMIDPDALSKMDLFKVFKQGKAFMVTANLALGAYQQRLAEQFGIQPGEEFRVAVHESVQAERPVMLIDREVGITLKRTMASLNWWRRLEIISMLISGVASKEEVSEEEIERLKEGDMLESAFAQFAEQRQEIYEPLVAERDSYMAARLLQEVNEHDAENILVVIGAGHMRGIERHLRAGITNPEQIVDELDRVPQGRRWTKIIPWLIVVLILAGFAIGFSKGEGLGWSMVLDWVLINGGLSALGAALAAAHPLTVLTAFLAAPLTSLNPTIGAGMVTAATEIYLRKPRVGDFSTLRHDTSRLRGWWSNRVSRTLLVFMLSTLGSALGTYLAGFRIIERLSG